MELPVPCAIDGGLRNKLKFVSFSMNIKYVYLATLNCLLYAGHSANILFHLNKKCYHYNELNRFFLLSFCSVSKISYASDELIDMIYILS